MFDIHDEPGTLIAKTHNVAYMNAFKKLLNARPDMTIPFFFEKNGKEYMGRAKTTFVDKYSYPNYHINFFDVDTQELGMKILDKKIFAKDRIELEQKMYDYYNSIK